MTQLAMEEIKAIDEDSAWAAVEGRDRRLDGEFVYAVRTTGVYCRPSCPSRRPHRVNVTFYGTPDDAEAAGFRECKRCRPRAASSTIGEDAVARAKEYLDANSDRRVPLAELAREVDMSAFHLQRTFKKVIGVSPRAYADARRVDRLKTRLKRGDTVSRATYEAGFDSSATVYARAAAGMGMTPATYRRGGQGVRIRYATAASSMGRVLVAATERGVCAVTLGGDDATLERSLRSEFSAADLSRDDDAIAPWLEAVVRYLDGLTQRVDVPVDARGTPFQQRVWSALRDIPFGETRSYTEVAKAIGALGSARAVASACARNPVAIVIPCHRVTRGTGETGGYRWGADRKRRLLAQEHAIVLRPVI
jgi:AraC family transcriptional regulator of adaptative response/methylated-DNA-[protein]-cysteine methyltransferase